MEQEEKYDSETEVTQKLCKTVAEEGGNRNITTWYQIELILDIITRYFYRQKVSIAVKSV